MNFGNEGLKSSKSTIYGHSHFRGVPKILKISNSWPISDSDWKRGFPSTNS